MFSPNRQPPHGWTAADHVLRPTETVFGYHARGQAMKGRCSRHDCRRNCTVDLAWLVRRRLDLAKAEVRQLYACNRLDGCGLQIDPEPPFAPLTLIAIAGVPDIAAQIRCRGCAAVKLRTIPDLINHLRTTRKGGPATNVLEVAPLLTAPCEGCKGTMWDVEILWPRENTMGWKTGDRPMSKAQAST